MPYLHFTGIALAILLISFYYFIRKVSAAYAQLRLKWHPPAPYDPRLLRFDLNAAFFRLIFVATGAVLFALALYLSSYQYLEQKATPAGEAVFKKSRVEYRSENSQQLTVSVQGQRVAAAGILLRFPTFLRYVGLANYHQVITFRGFNQNEYHYKPPPPDWIQNHADSLFVFFYKNRDWLTIPEAIYVESPYFTQGRHEIFVTHSGYIVN